MIARSAIPFAARSILTRVGLIPAIQRNGRRCGWQRTVAAFENWWTASYLAWRREILPANQSERFRRFCRDCGEDTPHEGSDEFGVGWYAQIHRCRHCGGEGMRIWPLA